MSKGCYYKPDGVLAGANKMEGRGLITVLYGNSLPVALPIIATPDLALYKCLWDLFDHTVNYYRYGWHSFVG